MEDKTIISSGTISHARPIAKVAWEEEGQKKERFISNEGLTIGRSNENDLVIHDLEASRFHSKILPEEKSLIVVDLESTNGTFLNEQAVTGDRILNNGDQIRIGKLKFDIAILTAEPEKETPKKEEMPFDQTMRVLPVADMPRFVVSVGMGKGTEFFLSKDRMSIGRATSNKKWDIDLVDKAVSRPHAELVKKNDQWVLTDLNSANGTTINGARLTESCVLQNGDVVTFGETTLIVHIDPGKT